MKKILYIITQSNWGGAQRYVFDLATNLQKSQEYETHVAGGGNGALFTRLEAQKLPTTRLKHLTRSINPYHDLRAYFEIKKLLDHIKPDIVHLNSSKAGFIGSLAAKRCYIKKIIYTAHGFVFNEPLSPFKKWLYKKIELASSKRIDKIICVSDFDRQSGIAAGIDPNKLITIHNGIDTNINFLSKEQARLSLRLPAGVEGAKRSNPDNASDVVLPKDDVQRNVKIAAVAPQDAGLPRNDKWIGCIANFYPTKGLDVLIEAMAQVDATLVLIGTGPEEQKLKVKSKKFPPEADQPLAGKVFFAGLIENASQYLKAFDLFVLPSRKEGLPYTLLEATAAGIPIVATKVGGVPEIIQDNVNGYLTNPNDVNDLADKINQALKQPLSPSLATDFSLAAMVTKTLNAYSS